MAVKKGEAEYEAAYFATEIAWNTLNFHELSFFSIRFSYFLFLHLIVIKIVWLVWLKID
jgi:hypothetical protein